MSFSLDNYITVAQRVALFYAEHPDGRIVAEPPRVVVIGDRTFVEVTARVYRTPDDPTPCTGTAWEPYPGRTPYTKDSEMMNAETSAVGRACANAGVAVQKAMASAEEVRNRQSDGASDSSPNRPGPRKVGNSHPKTTKRPESDTGVNGGTSDGLAGELIAMMDAYPAEVRKVLKQEFLARFGTPQSVAAARREEAREFIAGFVPVSL